MELIQRFPARRLIMAAAVALAFAIMPPFARADSTPGALTQLAAPNDCYGEVNQSSECGNQTGVGLEATQATVVSPDGKNVYVVGEQDSAIAEFTRNADGSLTPVSDNPCIAETASDSTCPNETAVGMSDPRAIAITPDGKNVYVTADDGNGSGTVAEFARNADGSLTQLAPPNACVAENMARSDSTSAECAGNQTGHGIEGPSSVAVSPDGRYVYAGDEEGEAVAWFVRNADGSLSQPGGANDCIEDQGSGSNDCATTGNGIGSVQSLVLSADGRSAYTSSSNRNFGSGVIAEFSRNSDGSLTQLAAPDDCIAEKGSGTGCGTVAIGLANAIGLAISPDGRNVYSASEFVGGPIAEFSRSSDGGLRQLPAPNSCIDEQFDSTGCPSQANGIGSGFELAVSPDGANVYAPAPANDCNGNSCDDVAEFARGADGSLTQLPSPDNCIQDDQTEGTECGNESGRGLGGFALAISPEGANVYITGNDDIAEFARNFVTHTLTVSRTGSGSGSVSDGTGAISCPPTCAHAYPAGSKVTLTETPSQGSVFGGWSGGGCSGTGSCQITIDADTAVTATFETVSGGQPAASTGPPHVTGSSRAGFSGSANPNGSQTNAFFQYGLDKRYSQPGSSGPNYTSSTPAQAVGSDNSNHPVSTSVSGLLPNALYHVRLVAFNSHGTTYGPDQTFTTLKGPPPPPPTLGKSFNAAPVSGIVFLLVNGKLIPITENTKIPFGSILDTLHGTLTLHTASGNNGKTFTGTFSGAVFKLTQTRFGPNRGLSTLALVEGTHDGAPSYASCKAKGSPDAHAALSRRVLQTLRSRASGRYSTRGRYAAGTVRGTRWTTSDRCNGTLIAVQLHSVLVTDLVKHITILIKAGHHYLATAP